METLWLEADVQSYYTCSNQWILKAQEKALLCSTDDHLKRFVLSYQADYNIYTNASTSGGSKNGVVAAVVTRGSPFQPEVVTTIKTKGRTLTSSCMDKATAIESALTWTSTNANHPTITILFCTDSKSLCEPLISSYPCTSPIHTSINSISSSIFIQWVPGHSDIPGKELVNKATKEATTIVTDTILPISFLNFIQVINEKIYDNPPSHKCVTQVYQHQKASQDSKQIKNRKDDILLTRLQPESPSIFPLSSSTWPNSRPNLFVMPSRWTRPYSLALQVSCRWHHKAKSIWEPQRVLERLAINHRSD